MSLTICKEAHAASPWMLFASVCLHCVLIVLIVVLSSSLWKQKRPPEETAVRVNVVSLLSAPITAETIQPVREAKTDVAILEPEHRLTDLERPKYTLQSKTAERVESPRIPLNKRKKLPQRVEEPKPQPAKKPAPEKPKEKEDPQAVIDASLAAVRQRLEAKKSENASVKSGGSTLDEESSRWLSGVKRLVYSRWSVFDDNRSVDRVTIIGVKLTDDGRLLEASITESSGDEMFDSSAMRAIRQAAPFPSIPAQVRERIKALGGLALKFTPGGIQ